LAFRDRFERKLHARKTAEDAGIKVVSENAPERVAMRPKLEAMVQDALRRGANEAAAMGGRIVRECAQITKYTYSDEITREGVFGWHEALRRKGNGDRTIYVKHTRLFSFLRFAKLDTSVLPPTPKYEKTLPTVYDPVDVGELMERCDDRLNLILSVALQCGLREQELVYLQYADLHFRHRTLRVRGKEQYGFRVKDAEERDVAVPDALLARLKTWHQEHEVELLFGTRGDRPDGHLLRGFKRASRAADLNCGHCERCKSKRKECRGWTLHRFRRSYMTTMLRSGVDLRTVQAMAGHADITSTMRYLRPASGAEIQSKINLIAWTS
jgi:integrase